MKTSVVALISLFVLATNASFAQESKWRVNLIDGKKFSRVALGDLGADSLTLIQAGQSQRIPIESIREIRLLRSSRFLIGFGIGFLVGAGAVIVTPEEKSKTADSSDPWAGDYEIVSKETAAISFGVIGGLLGGLVGAGASADKIYDLSTMNTTMKAEKIQVILLKHKSKK